MKTNRKHNTIKISELIGVNSGIITSIEVQKNNANRCSIFLDNKFLIGVSSSAISNFGLAKGISLSQNQLDEILRFEATGKLKEYVIGLLARRDHARYELESKAIKKGYSKIEINPILDELTEKGYINNTAFAQKFAHDKFHFNNWGIQKIRMELRKRGIKNSEIDQSLDQFSSSDSEEKVQLLITKNRARFLRVDEPKRKKKIFDFLLRKGYDSESILKVLNKIDLKRL